MRADKARSAVLRSRPKGGVLTSDGVAGAC
jgi:hypothetical protein